MGAPASLKFTELISIETTNLPQKKIFSCIQSQSMIILEYSINGNNVFSLFQNLSEWMSELSEDVKTNKNITQIAIPGSHDCGTYSLDKSLPVGPDEADILQSLGN
jgi:hypothetical protein